MNNPLNQPFDPGSGATVSAVSFFSSGPNRYPVRTSTNVQPLLCGEIAFAAVARALRAATSSINMCFWGLDPCMLLERGSNGQWDMNSMLGEILVAKARDGIPVKIVVWDHYKAGIGSGSGGNADLLDPDLGGNNVNLGAFYAIQDAIPNFEIKMTNALGSNLHGRESLFPSFHQKTIIVDVETPSRATAFVMGHNMLWLYWSTTDLPATNPRRQVAVRAGAPGRALLDMQIDRAQQALDRTNGGHDRRNAQLRLDRLRDPAPTDQGLFSYTTQHNAPIGPLLDISTQIWGGGVADVYDNFHNLWTLNGGTVLPPPASVNPAAFGNPNGNTTTQAQMAATFNIPTKRNIRDFYVNAISGAQRYVLMVNQYFRHWEATEEIIDAWLARQIPSQKRVPLICCTNDFNNSWAQGGHDGETLQYFTDEGMDVSLCKLRTGQAGAKTDIYIHAKLLIVDDVFYTIGSANYNWRSLDGDPEFNVGVHDPAQSRTLRREVMNMLIGDPMEDLMSGDPMVAFRRWEAMVAENGPFANSPQRLPNGRAIQYEASRFQITPNRLAQNGTQPAGTPNAT